MEGLFMAKEFTELEKKQLKEVKEALEELKQLARQEGYDIDKVVDEAQNKFKDVDEDLMFELQKEQAFKDGISFPHSPNITFKGEQAVRILEEQREFAKANNKIEKVGGQLSPDEYADVADKYFRVDITKEPKRYVDPAVKKTLEELEETSEE